MEEKGEQAVVQVLPEDIMPINQMAKMGKKVQMGQVVADRNHQERFLKESKTTLLQ